jgi:hypothetical protein
MKKLISSYNLYQKERSQESQIKKIASKANENERYNDITHRGSISGDNKKRKMRGEKIIEAGRIQMTKRQEAKNRIDSREN